jgi:hypothetical protein
MFEQLTNQFTESRIPERLVPERQNLERHEPLVSLAEQSAFFSRNQNRKERTEEPAFLDFREGEPIELSRQAQARERLNEALQQMPPELRRSAQADMQRIESPDRVPPLRSEQIAELYQTTERLLRGNGNPGATAGEDSGENSGLNLEQRQLLAAGILDNAGSPHNIDQGRFSTCNVATIEERLYSLNPEQAARIVAQVGLTGAYRAPDGFTATLPHGSITPDDEAAVPPASDRADGLRNYASQIMAMALINDHWQRRNPALRFERGPLESTDGTGEAIFENGRLINRPRQSHCAT